MLVPPASRGGSRRRSHRARPALLLALLLALASLLHCGSVGDPLPPLLNIPEASGDLTARQVEQAVVLEWTRPELTTEGARIRDLERFIVWGMELGGPDPPPAGVFEQYRKAYAEIEGPALAPVAPGQRFSVRIGSGANPPPAGEPLAGKRMAFAVEALSSRGRSAGVSNFAVIEVIEPPARTAPPRLAVEPGGVVLEWEAAERAAAYAVLRAGTPQGPFAELGRTAQTSFRDAAMEWGETYSYAVRTMGRSSTGEVLGPLSEASTVTPNDTFPPQPPRDLVAVAAEHSIELSWNPNEEPDLAGYRVYRISAAGERTPLHTEPLQTAAYSDLDAPRQQELRYEVTALDQRGNESAPSQHIAVRR